jgi:hypothetical protein
MRIARHYDPRISFVLAPWYVTDFEDVVQIGEEVHHRLAEFPDDTLCLIASHKKQIQAILIAYARQKDVFVWQARAIPRFPLKNSMYSWLKRWAKKRGYNKLAAQSKRPRAICRMFGFRPSGNGEIIKEI